MAAYPTPHNADAKARIFEDAQGNLWVTHVELLLNGYDALEDFSIVYLNGKFYELQSYAEKPDSWWVEEVGT